MEWDSPSKTKCHLNRGTVDPIMLDTAFGGVIFLESPEIHMFSFLVKSVRGLSGKCAPKARAGQLRHVRAPEEPACAPRSAWNGAGGARSLCAIVCGHNVRKFLHARKRVKSQKTGMRIVAALLQQPRAARVDERGKGACPRSACAGPLAARLCLGIEDSKNPRGKQVPAAGSGLVGLAAPSRRQGGCSGSHGHREGSREGPGRWRYVQIQIAPQAKLGRR